jgi:hypothetical protein
MFVYCKKDSIVHCSNVDVDFYCKCICVCYFEDLVGKEAVYAVQFVQE